MHLGRKMTNLNYKFLIFRPITWNFVIKSIKFKKLCSLIIILLEIKNIKKKLKILVIVGYTIIEFQLNDNS